MLQQANGRIVSIWGEAAASAMIAECETPGSFGRPGVTAYVEAGCKPAA